MTKEPITVPHDTADKTALKLKTGINDPILTLTSVPLDQLVRFDNPFHFRRKSFDPEIEVKDRELLESIRANGVVEPICVQQLPTNEDNLPAFQVVFGHRRVTASRLLGLDSIPAVVFDEDASQLFLCLVENTGDLQVSHYEKAVSLQLYRQLNSDMNNAEVARRLGMSQAEVSNLTQALKYCPPLLSILLHSQYIEVKAVLILQPIWLNLSREEQIELGRMLVKGISRSQAWELRSLIEQGVPAVMAANWVLHKEVLEIELKPSSSSPVIVQEEIHESNPKGEAMEVPIPQGVEESVSFPPNIEEQATALRFLCGISRQEVAALLHEGHAQGLNFETIAVASVGVSRGANRQNALLTAHRILTARGNKSTVSLIRKKMKLMSAARAAVPKSPPAVQDFLNRFFGLRPGPSEQEE